MTVIARYSGEAERMVGGGATPLERDSSSSPATADRVARAALQESGHAAGAAAPLVVPAVVAPRVLTGRWGLLAMVGHLATVVATSTTRVFAAKTLPLPTRLTDLMFRRAADRAGFGNVVPTIYSLVENRLLGDITQAEIMHALAANLISAGGGGIAMVEGASPFLIPGPVDSDVPPILETEIRQEMDSYQVDRETAIKNLMKQRIGIAKAGVMSSAFPVLLAGQQAAIVSVGLTGFINHNVLFFVALDAPTGERSVEYFNPSAVTLPPTDTKPTVVKVKITVPVEGESSPRRAEEAITLGEVGRAFQEHVGAAPEFSVVQTVYQNDWHNCAMFTARYVQLRTEGVPFADLSTGARGRDLASTDPLTHRQALVDVLIASVERTMRAPTSAAESESDGEDAADVYTVFTMDSGSGVAH